MTDTKPINILIIDDDTFLADILSVRLKRNNIEPTYAPGGQIALDMLTKSPFDAILLDVVMPGMDGFEALEKIKAHPRGSTIPVIMYSSEMSPENLERSKKLGAEQFIEKVEVSSGEVVNRIKTVVGAHT